MPKPPPDQEALLNEKWDVLFKQLCVYTDKRVKMFRWRGAHDGVLPNGHTADGIAADAISNLLTGKYPWRHRSRCYTQDELWRELTRLASQEVKNLLVRLENRTTVNYDEPDITGRSKGNLYVSDKPQPDQDAEQQEAQAQLAEFRSSLTGFLVNEPLLVSLVEYAFKGESRREEIARSLRVSPQQITNARKKLERRLAEYSLLYPQYPSTLIQEIAHA